ncbi:MAG: methyltransferase domain-containing protein, partial [Candidatus Dormibacteraeota bacterium]|nr:methyltransferase domain-containing protein [Candidatus Dormibacteraeota bacterium]
RTATGASLAERVAALSWYHTIELPGGVVTNGQFDHRPLVRHYGLPANMHGLSALDVASFDGFWAFEMERRGARVTSIDLDRVASLDLPGPARLQLEEEGIDRDHDAGRAFAMAREALGSNVERRVESIYDLTPERHGTFDFVHVADVLLHLENPTRALRAVRAVTAGQALIVDAFRPGQDGAQWVEYRGGWQGLVWWMPSLSALGQMVLDAGFREVRLLNAYRLRKTAAGDPGLWRAVLQATP